VYSLGARHHALFTRLPSTTLFRSPYTPGELMDDEYISPVDPYKPGKRMVKKVQRPDPTSPTGFSEVEIAKMEPGVSFGPFGVNRSEEHTSELQSREKLVCRLLPEK